jgi:hypothetical protein
MSDDPQAREGFCFTVLEVGACATCGRSSPRCAHFASAGSAGSAGSAAQLPSRKHLLVLNIHPLHEVVLKPLLGEPLPYSTELVLVEREPTDI